MSRATRAERLVCDLQSLTALREQSRLFGFEASGEPPDRYVLLFHGRGIRHVDPSDGSISYLEEHRVELRMPYSYPRRPPDIRWITPLFHPNVSYSGSVSWRDLGLEWTPQLELDVLCERLWDVARLAYVLPEQATNYAASRWYAGHAIPPGPVDDRGLQATTTPREVNVISYRRAAGGAPTVDDQEDSILYIGDDATPAPRASRSGEDDQDNILYIGDV